MVPYFQAGLRKKEACLWLVSQRNGLDFCRVTVQNLIPGFSRYESSGQFKMLSAEDWYLSHEAFDQGKAFRNAQDHADEFRKLGFQHIRVAGDIGGAIPRKDWPEVEDYERRISVWIKPEPVVALCAYPILECTPSQTKGILDSHEDVLIGRL